MVVGNVDVLIDKLDMQKICITLYMILLCSCIETFPFCGIRRMVNCRLVPSLARIYTIYLIFLQVKRCNFVTQKLFPRKNACEENITTTQEIM